MCVCVRERERERGVCAYLHNTTHSTLPMAVAQDPVGDVTQFVARFEDQFGASHAPLPRTSYSQTVEQAKSELRFLWSTSTAGSGRSGRSMQGEGGREVGGYAR